MMALLVAAELLESFPDPLDEAPQPLSARLTPSTAAMIAGILNFLTVVPLISCLVHAGDINRYFKITVSGPRSAAKFTDCAIAFSDDELLRAWQRWQRKSAALAIPACSQVFDEKMTDMSEKERMLSGRLYVADDPELKAGFARKARLLQQINRLDWDQVALRMQLFGELFAQLGEGAYIERTFHCDYGSNIRIGKNFYANVDCIFLDVAPITIGDNVFFGPRIGLYTPYHPIDAQVRNAQLEGGLPITIGSNVWFGGDVTVCPDVTIGSNVVIGAGSVVVSDIPDNSVAVGNPCKVVRPITEQDRQYWEHKAAEYRAEKAAEVEDSDLL
jgi:maltose O-acetyltransferase